MIFDAQIVQSLNTLVGTSPLLDALLLFLASYLPFVLIVIFLLLLYFSSYSKSDKLYLFWVTVVSALVARVGITELIRLLYQRPRPFATLDLNTLFLSDSWSFPSGHAAFFFAAAAAIYLYNKKWGIWFFVGTLLVTISRVIVGVHYPTDILGGLLIGILVAYGTFVIAEKWKVRETANLSR